MTSHGRLSFDFVDSLIFFIQFPFQIKKYAIYFATLNLPPYLLSSFCLLIKIIMNIIIIIVVILC